MLSPAEKEVLAELKTRLVARFGTRLRALKLFGSRARGGGRDDSDLDVLVEVSGVTRDERRTIVNLAWDVGTAGDLVISPLVVGEGACLPGSIAGDAVTL